MVTLVILGLFFDIVGAAILVVADLPGWRKEFSSYCPRLKHVESARRQMVTKEGGEEVWIRDGDRGHEDVLNILQYQLSRNVTGDIRSNWLGNDRFVINFGEVESRDTPILQKEFSTWVQEWEARYIRRLGLGTLVCGFALQIVGSLF